MSHLSTSYRLSHVTCIDKRINKMRHVALVSWATSHLLIESCRTYQLVINWVMSHSSTHTLTRCVMSHWLIEWCRNDHQIFDWVTSHVSMHLSSQLDESCCTYRLFVLKIVMIQIVISSYIYIYIYIYVYIYIFLYIYIYIYIYRYIMLHLSTIHVEDSDESYCTHQ